MATHTGTTLSCDRMECDATLMVDEHEAVPEQADRRGWTRTDDGRDFCPRCTRIRAERKKPAELVPDGVRLMRAFEAAEAAGWERREYDEETGEAHFYCCGSEVKVESFIGAPYYAICETCETAIADIFGPSFEGGAVAMPDPDKVDVESPHTWALVSELEAAQANANGSN